MFAHLGAARWAEYNAGCPKCHRHWGRIGESLERGFDAEEATEYVIDMLKWIRSVEISLRYSNSVFAKTRRTRFLSRPKMRK